MTDIAALISTSSPVAPTGDVGTDASPEEFADALASADSEMGADGTTTETDDAKKAETAETAETESATVAQLLLGLESTATLAHESPATPAAGTVSAADTETAAPDAESADLDSTDATMPAAPGAVTATDVPDAAAGNAAAMTEPGASALASPSITASAGGQPSTPLADQSGITTTGPTTTPTATTITGTTTPTGTAPLAAATVDATSATVPTDDTALPSMPALDEAAAGEIVDHDQQGVAAVDTEAGPAEPIDTLPESAITGPGAATAAATLANSETPSAPAAVADAPAAPTTVGADPIAAASTTQATAPAAPTAPAEVAQATTAPAAPTPFDPAEASPATQVAEALRDVRRLTDGTHRLSLQLHPEDLGAVQVEVALREGRLHLRAVAQTEAGRAALESSLPELRSELVDAGVDAGSLEVGGETTDGSAFARPDRGDQTETSAIAQAAGPISTRHDLTTPTPNPMSTSSLVDVRL